MIPRSTKLPTMGRMRMLMRGTRRRRFLGRRRRDVFVARSGERRRWCAVSLMMGYRRVLLEMNKYVITKLRQDAATTAA